MNYFLISKPTQYVTALALRDQLKLNSCTLLVVEKFSGSEGFVSRVRSTDVWSSVISASSRSKVFVKKLLSCGVGGRLYTDSDIFISNILNRLPFIFNSYSVFDEGFYSYLSDLTHHLETQDKQSKLLLYKLFVLRRSHAENKRTNLYLYHPVARRDRDAILINDGLLITVQKKLSHLLNVYAIDMSVIDSVIVRLKVPQVRIYCSSHDPSRLNDQEFVDSMNFIKLHPVLPNIDLTNSLPSLMPIEVLIAYIIKCGVKVDLYHEGSSIMLHLVSFIKKGMVSDNNLGTYGKEFSSVYEQVLCSIKENTE